MRGLGVCSTPPSRASWASAFSSCASPRRRGGRCAGAAASRPLLVPTAGLLPSFSAPWRHRPPFLLTLGPAELFIDILAAGRLRTLSDLAQFLDGGDGDGGAVGRLSPAQLRAAAKPLDLRAVCLQLVRESEASSASVGRLAHAQFWSAQRELLEAYLRRE